MANRQTLLIRNLPVELSDADKEDLLRHFGAISVKIVTCKRKPIVFAKFENEAKARNVLYRLHQLEVLGNRLIVEYAKESVNLADPRIDKVSIDKNDSGKEYFKEFINRLNAWNSSVDFHQPPPPHLKYIYPRANVATINNIAHALASVPKFYTQVLHLMNKMNLPPPFSNIPDPPELQLHQSTTAPPPPATGPSNEDEASESELESDPEDHKQEENVPVKRTLPQNRKKIKRPKFIKPPVVSKVHEVEKNCQNSEQVFEKVDFASHKKIEMKVNSDSVEAIKLNQEAVEENTDNLFIKMNRVKTTDKDDDDDNSETKNDDEEISSSANDVISEKELNANRISEKDFVHLPAFKNYHAGAPSCRLYIKNLPKNVTVDDLNYIYKRYVLDTDDEQTNIFDVRLMQEGRMKGQAFVTLQNVTLAQKALKETNGYILKDKPIVVVFARSAKPKS